MSRARPAAALRPVTPVGILADRLAALARVDSGVGAAVRAELGALADLAAGLEPYLEQNTTAESPDLADLARRTREHDWAGTDSTTPGLEAEMLSGHVEGQLLKLLVNATSAVRVLEVGLFTGYSALAMAEALPPDGRLVACELDPEVAAFAQRAFDTSPVGSRIDVRIGPAAQTLAGLADEGQRFDLIFIDADKAGYRGYVETALSGGLLAPDGLLCIDNTLMQGQPWTAGEATPNGRAIAEFNAWLRQESRLTCVQLPLRDGLTLARRAGQS